MDNIYDERPWGSYTVLESKPGYWIKRIEVKPGGRLSLQYHKGRAEDWIVVQGIGYSTVDDFNANIEVGSHIHIDIGQMHRICNNGIVPLVFIEVAIGTDLREDDIIRIEDDYGRKGD